MESIIKSISLASIKMMGVSKGTPHLKDYVTKYYRDHFVLP